MGDTQDSPTKKKTHGTSEGDNGGEEETALRTLTFQEAQQLTVGQIIDLKDEVDRWLPAEVTAVDDNMLSFHFKGWDTKWDKTYDIKTRYVIMAPGYSRSRGKTERLPDLDVGSKLDVCFEKKWQEGEVKKTASGQRIAIDNSIPADSSQVHASWSHENNCTVV